MYPISPIYADRLRQREREWDVKAVIAGVEYNNTKIVDFSIENSLVLGEEFEIGTAILSKLTLTLRTNDIIPPNAKIIPYLALAIGNITWNEADYAWEDAVWAWNGGFTDWLPLGEFYIDNREEINGLWVFECYDKLVFADIPYDSSLSFPASMQDVWDEVCETLDYDYDANVIIDPSYIIPVKPIEYTMRQVMGYIAGANSASVYVGKDGVLKFKRFDVAETPVFSMDASDYMKANKLNPIKTYTRVVVYYDNEDGLYYESGTGDDSHTLYIENPFATQQIADDVLEKINGFAYLPIQLPARGYPQLEAGDIIELTRDESVSWLDASSPWEDMELPWNGEAKYQTIALHTVFNFRGGLSMSIEAPSKSDQQSEFVVEGTIKQQITKLNKDTVKQGKPYHGVTITKEDGIISERSDHYSKLTINSDVLLNWEIGGVRKLFYDDVDDAIKFSGVIEASEFIGGTITGSMFQTTPGTYPRVEINPSTNLFSAYGSASNRLVINPFDVGSSSPSLAFYSSDTFIGYLFGDLLTGLAIATLSRDIQISSGKDLWLNTPSGFLRISGWDKLINTSSGTSLSSALNAKADKSILSGQFYVSSTPGGPADKLITYTNGVITSAS